jgi:rubrerythrin
MHENVTRAMIDTLIAMKKNGKVGMCIGCGTMQEGMNADAEEWPCDKCGAHGVYAVKPLSYLWDVEPRRSSK